jgi:hypothetical protein
MTAQRAALRRVKAVLAYADRTEHSSGIIEDLRAVVALAERAVEAEAEDGDVCPESGTAHRTADGWHSGTETCGTCGRDVRIRNDGMVARHRRGPPRAGKRSRKAGR